MWDPNSLVAQYGAFSVREPPLRRLGDKALSRTHYVITTTSETDGEFSITQILNRRSDLPTVVETLRRWLQHEPVQVAIREQELAEAQSPAYLANLQRALDVDPSLGPKTAAEMIAYREHELDIVKARYALVRERLRELEAQIAAEGGHVG